jgi:hypothetical protein
VKYESNILCENGEMKKCPLACYIIDLECNAFIHQQSAVEPNCGELITLIGEIEICPLVNSYGKIPIDSFVEAFAILFW